MSDDKASPEPLPAPARRGRDREAWVGLFVIVGVLGTMAALFLLTDASTFRGRYMISTFVDDAGGVRRGDPVEYRGVNIGRVKGFRVLGDGVEIRLEIEGAYRVPRDSRVELSSTGILGNMAADILPGVSPDRAPAGARLPGARGKRLGDTAGHLAERADVVMKRVEAVLSERTARNVEDSTGELSSLLTELNGAAQEQRLALAELTASLRRSAGNVEVVTGAELQRSVGRVDRLTADLQATMPALTGAAASLQRSASVAEGIVARVDRGEGTLGRLLHDDLLYRQANRAVETTFKAATQIGLLAEDLRKNPKRYLSIHIF